MTETHVHVVGYHWNCVDELVLIAGPKPLLTELGIHILDWRVGISLDYLLWGKECWKITDVGRIVSQQFHASTRLRKLCFPWYQCMKEHLECLGITRFYLMAWISAQNFHCETAAAHVKNGLLKRYIIHMKKLWISRQIENGCAEVCGVRIRRRRAPMACLDQQWHTF